MCGRFALYSSGDDIARAFAVGVTELVPRYNIAPSQPIAGVRALAGGREVAWLRWGLVPSWAKDAKIAPINAKAETIAERPFFRGALRQRRCLVPADGWYEWQAQGKHKQPYFFVAADGQPLAIAGLWETWEGQGEPLATCAVLTTTANELAAPVHDRMPVILPAEAYTAWLDAANQDVEALREWLRPFPSAALGARSVGPRVNNARFDGPACLGPFPAPPSLF